MSDSAQRIKRKAYERELARLQVELVHLQQWVAASGAKVCVVFEGRDTAGKGGVIKRITERVSLRVFRTVALAAPTEREKSQNVRAALLTVFNVTAEAVVARHASIDAFRWPVIGESNEQGPPMNPPFEPPAWWADALITG